MTASLHDRLADLASDAPPGGPVPDLWDRGRRYHRQRRAGTAVIAAAAVVLLGVVAGVSWQRSAPVPAPAGGPVGLPDRLWSPSPWLPSTRTPGRLVALGSADRGSWTGSHPGVVGVSAVSGEYAFLDLPGADLENGGVELAPDGRHVAYWLTGSTTDTPDSESGPITGVAVCNTTTGRVRRHWIESAHGLRPDFLTWTDSSTVVFSAGQIRGGDDDSLMDRSTSSFGTVTAWSLDGEPEAVPGVEPGAELQGAGHGRILVGTSSTRPAREHLLVDLTDPDRAHYLEVPSLSVAVGSLHFVALGPFGDRIALVPGKRSPNRVAAGPTGDLSEVPHTARTLGVVDWIDADTIATLRYRDPGWTHLGLFRVAVSTGRSHEIVRLAAGGFGNPQFATDFLDAPSVHGVKPPTPLDPRLTAGLSVAIVLLGGGALVLWRRRVRA
jgi:hypothetical protein